jgi:hypothetical protein
MEVGFHVSNLDHKWAHSIVIGVTVILDQKPCENQSMVGISSHLTWPPLGGSVSWSVDHKLVSSLVKGGSGFKACYV